MHRSFLGGGSMAGRALGAFAFLVGLSGVVACGSSAGNGGAPGGAPAPVDPAEDVEAEEGAPASFGRYQFVETEEGMTVEALGEGSVQTLSCAVRTCAGLCDECALAACRAAGELEDACAALVSSCEQTCNCDSGGLGCGFPVCAFDRQLCYIGAGELGGAVPGDGPEGPSPDPFPEVDGSSRPSGSGASQPTPVP